MINCNPETVSTDYDTSDRLYFEPLTFEDVSAVLDNEKPDGDPRPVRRPDAAEARAAARGRGIPDLGHVARVDRPRRGPRALRPAPRGARRSRPRRTPRRAPRARRSRRRGASAIPLVVRPSYVLGGRAMAVVFDEALLASYIADGASRAPPEHPVLIDRFLDDAVELDVDALCDGEGRRGSAAIQQHIEEAGHPLRRLVLGPAAVEDPAGPARRDPRRDAAARRGPVGARPRQHPVRDPARQALRPRGQPARLAHRAVRVEGDRRSDGPRRGALLAAGRSPRVPESARRSATPSTSSSRRPVFPFRKFPGEDVLLGPEMKSTGEVMGVSPRFGDAFAKACEAVGTRLPLSGRAFLTVNPYDKAAVVPIGRELADLGLRALRDRGHARSAARGGRRGGAGLQGQRGQPQRGRPHGGG